MPVWNYDKFQKTRNFKYFIKDFDYNSEYKFKNRDIKYIENSFYRFMDSFDYSSFRLQQLYAECLHYNVLFQAGDLNSERNYNKTFSEYIKELDKNNTNYEILDKKYTTANDAYSVLRMSNSYSTLLKHRCQIFDYRTLKCDAINSVDLLKESIILGKNIGHDIDIEKTNIAKYESIKEVIIDIQKQQEKTK